MKVDHQSVLASSFMHQLPFQELILSFSKVGSMKCKMHDKSRHRVAFMYTMIHTVEVEASWTPYLLAGVFPPAYRIV